MKHLSKKLNAVLLFCSTYGSPMESCKTNDCIQISQINVAHSLSLFCLYVEPAHGSRIDKTLELFGTSSGSVFFSARRDMDEFSAA